MNTIAVPIDDAREARWASKQVIEMYRREPVHVHLVNVQHPLSRHISQFLNSRDIRAHHLEAGMRILEPAIKALDKAGVPHADHVLVGRKVESIVRFAKEHSCSQVVLETPSEGLLSAFGLGSLAGQIQRAIAANAAKAGPS
jgi:nucleotide-binding universal stress UspA family protein